MKNILLLLLILSNFTFAQIEKKALFIGNSYTNSNDLSGLVSAIATADGNILIKDQNAPGGYIFEAHTTNPTTLSKISADDWDFVILQEQSQLPSFPWEQVHEECFPFAEILVDSIRSANPCAVPIFFNTWGRRDGEPMWDSINTFIKMNQRLYVAYDYMADTHSGKLAPIGIGFQHIDTYLSPVVPFEELYVGDGSHPSIYGSYLSACYFYELIFEISIDGNTHIPDGMTAEERDFLQGVAHHVLHEVDSLTIDYTIPTASFTVTHDGAIATFNNTSTHGFEYFWEFGDGETSTEKHPIHTYPDESDYTATLTVTNCGQEAVSIGGIDYSGIEDLNLSKLNVYPNPSTGSVTINFEGDTAVLQVFTLDGQLYSKAVIEDHSILNLPAGIYLVRVNNETRRLIIL
ncbi:MAG: hypothetical protein ACI8ZM_005301 [Crocinitomix sp.]|jgi:hypothetical protein